MNENDSKQTIKKTIFSKKSIPYLLLLPAFLFYAVFWLLPVLSTVVPQPASKLTAIALVSKAAITFFFINSLLSI